MENIIESLTTLTHSFLKDNGADFEIGGLYDIVLKIKQIADPHQATNTTLDYMYTLVVDVHNILADKALAPEKKLHMINNIHERYYFIIQFIHAHYIDHIRNEVISQLNKKIIIQRLGYQRSKLARAQSVSKCSLLREPSRYSIINSDI
jgi:hypothetical protein